MSQLKTSLRRLAEGKHLTAEEAEDAIDDLLAEGTEDWLIASFLTALRIKGERDSELLGCARALRKHCRHVETGGRPLLDTCGTGGDGSSSLNISTMAALVAAAAGVPVAKHGNRSVTSRCGSADLIEALGMPMVNEPGQVLEHLDQFGFAFLFAPKFHPATARAGAIRRQLGFRTIFNLLGPLVNPARASYQVIGVFAPEWCLPVARVAGMLGVESCLVVHGEGGWDELTPWGPSKLAWWKGGTVHESVLDPKALGIKHCCDDQLQGNSPEENAAESERILRGHDRPASEVVALNAAAGLMAAGHSSNWVEALELTRSVLRTAQAWDLVTRLRASSKP